MKKTHGRIVILSGPSGSGKTTFHGKLLKSRLFRGRLVRSVSVTTRPRRPGEKDGKDYFFISKKKYDHMKRAGQFLETEKVFGKHYGTPQKKVREVLAQGKNVLLCIDVKGARTVSRTCPEALKVFIKPPSLEELKERLKKRGTETPCELNRRFKIARDELRETKRYDYVIVNDDFPRAYRRLESLLLKELRLTPKEPGGKKGAGMSPNKD